MQVFFPSLKSLSMDCTPLTTVQFTTANTPQLRTLTIFNQSQQNAAGFTLDLPHLITLSFDSVILTDDSDFGPSLSRYGNSKNHSKTPG